MTSKFKMVTTINCWAHETSGWGLNWMTVAMREKTRGLMARIDLWEGNWEGPHATDSVASEWGIELAEGLNLTVATGILWACHGDGPDPSWVEQWVGLMMGAWEWCTRLRSGARVRVVHEMGARENVAVHEYGVVHEMGARVVHESSEWCKRTSGARDYGVVHERYMQSCD